MLEVKTYNHKCTEEATVNQEAMDSQEHMANQVATVNQGIHSQVILKLAMVNQVMDNLDILLNNLAGLMHTET